MVRVGRRLVPLKLTKAERETLERWVRRRKTAQQLALRARIVLRSAQGHANREIARQLGVHEATVCKWRGRFVKKRVEGLSDEPRPGAPRKISDETVERIVTMTLESTPTDATPWSTRDLAKRIGVSQSTVSRDWRAFNLQPYRVETFRLSTDPLFVEQVRDIVGLYVNPPDHAVVLCVDEKSQAGELRTQDTRLRMHPPPRLRLRRLARLDRILSSVDRTVCPKVGWTCPRTAARRVDWRSASRKSCAPRSVRTDRRACPRVLLLTPRGVGPPPALGPLRAGRDRGPGSRLASARGQPMVS